MELIDRDAVLKTIPNEEMVARMAVMSAPPVDAEPVIRCMDCKWFGAWYCDLLHFGIVDLHKYCAWAERKEE